MREIKKIIIHCSYTPPSMDIGREEIDKWHKDRGWNSIGYHYVIRRDGTIEKGRPDAEVGAHVQGENDDSLGVCMIGGRKEGQPVSDDFNFTIEQLNTLAKLTYELVLKYSPEDSDKLVDVCGHREFTRGKTCPCFNVKAWWYRE